MRAESFGWPRKFCWGLGKFGEDVGAGRRGDVELAGPSIWVTVVWGLKVTVLCCFVGFLTVDVGDGRSGDVSVDAEAIVVGDLLGI